MALEPECKAGKTVASGLLVRVRMGEDYMGLVPGAGEQLCTVEWRRERQNATLHRGSVRLLGAA